LTAVQDRPGQLTPRRPAGRAPVLAVAAVLVTALVGAVALVGPGGDGSVQALGAGPVTVEVRIHHSRFDPERITVRAGSDVRFVIVNDDPINHEVIVGDDEVHRRHELGSEAAHPPVPGEVSVPAGQQAETTFAFPATGEVVYACHLPGHLAYGMQGVVTVIAP
jgi:uncharacterized cupredoxin-like copper-binding protein